MDIDFTQYIEKIKSEKSEMKIGIKTVSSSQKTSEVISYNSDDSIGKSENKLNVSETKSLNSKTENSLYNEHNVIENKKFVYIDSVDNEISYKDSDKIENDIESPNKSIYKIEIINDYNNTNISKSFSSYIELIRKTENNISYKIDSNRKYDYELNIESEKSDKKEDTISRILGFSRKKEENISGSKFNRKDFIALPYLILGDGKQNVFMTEVEANVYRPSTPIFSTKNSIYVSGKQNEEKLNSWGETINFFPKKSYREIFDNTRENIDNVIEQIDNIKNKNNGNIGLNILSSISIASSVIGSLADNANLLNGYNKTRFDIRLKDGVGNSRKKGEDIRLSHKSDENADGYEEGISYSKKEEDKISRNKTLTLHKTLHHEAENADDYEYDYEYDYTEELPLVNYNEKIETGILHHEAENADDYEYDEDTFAKSNAKTGDVIQQDFDYDGKSEEITLSNQSSENSDGYEDGISYSKKEENNVLDETVNESEGKEEIRISLSHEAENADDYDYDYITPKNKIGDDIPYQIKEGKRNSEKASAIGNIYVIPPYSELESEQPILIQLQNNLKFNPMSRTASYNSIKFFGRIGDINQFANTDSLSNISITTEYHLGELYTETIKDLQLMELKYRSLVFPGQSSGMYFESAGDLPQNKYQYYTMPPIINIALGILPNQERAIDDSDDSNFITRAFTSIKVDENGNKSIYYKDFAVTNVTIDKDVEKFNYYVNDAGNDYYDTAGFRVTLELIEMDGNYLTSLPSFNMFQKFWS